MSHNHKTRHTRIYTPLWKGMFSQTSGVKAELCDPSVHTENTHTHTQQQDKPTQKSQLPAVFHKCLFPSEQHSFPTAFNELVTTKTATI